MSNISRWWLTYVIGLICFVLAFQVDAKLGRMVVILTLLGYLIVRTVVREELERYFENNDANKPDSASGESSDSDQDG